jgi:hypothetical protein
VDPLTALVRSLGNDRALANARSALDARLHEEQLVQRLARRIEIASAPIDETDTTAA